MYRCIFMPIYIYTCLCSWLSVKSVFIYLLCRFATIRFKTSENCHRMSCENRFIVLKCQTKSALSQLKMPYILTYIHTTCAWPEVNTYVCMHFIDTPNELCLTKPFFFLRNATFFLAVLWVRPRC